MNGLRLEWQYIEFNVRLNFKSKKSSVYENSEFKISYWWEAWYVVNCRVGSKSTLFNIRLFARNERYLIQISKYGKGANFGERKKETCLSL